MDFSELGFVPVAAIVVICLLLGKMWKTADRLDNKWIPVACGFTGGCLGIIAMYVVDGFPAHDILNAIAYGIVSGFAATGIHQAVYQHTKEIDKLAEDEGGE